MLDKFIASQGMPEDDASEIRAISLALSRSITRRAQVGFMSMFMSNSSVCAIFFNRMWLKICPLSCPFPRPYSLSFVLHDFPKRWTTMT